MRHPLAIVCAAVASLGGAAMGQIAVTSVGGAPFIEAWVDPCNGDDVLASTSFPPCQSLPYRTINAAIAALAPFASSVQPGLVHCDAGIYANSTNGEQLPIQMRNFVHLQGVGARQTVLRGEGASASALFLPFSGGSCRCGGYTSGEVIVDLSFLFDQYEEMIDGFTFQGGHVQVYARGEIDVYARVSNCVFDMLSYDKTVLKDDGSGVPVPNPLPGPVFGMLIVHDYHPGVPYYDTPINVLNNTFIMAWLPGQDSDARFAQSDAVAICDVNNPLCGLPPWMADPDPSLRGIGPMNVQNNLIRTAPGQRATAMLGLDGSATSVRFGTPTGPSNAFDRVLVGGFSAGGTFCSKFNSFQGNGLAPTPRVHINPTTGGRDPAFVGEMTSSTFGLPLTVARDWRILPVSPLVDVGSMPRPLAPGGILVAGNLSRYTEPVAALVAISSFDLDGEVYGNPRVQPAFRSTTLRADIGFDEAHLVVDTGGHANDSVSHRWNPAVTPQVCGPLNQGLPIRGLVFPTDGTFAMSETRFPIPLPVGVVPPCASGAIGFYPAYTTMWGTIVPPLGVVNFPQFYNLAWMDPAFVTPGPGGAATPLTYFAPNDPTPLTFGVGTAPIVGATPCQFVNEQVLFVPTGSTRTFISNLQSSTD